MHPPKRPDPPRARDWPGRAICTEVSAGLQNDQLINAADWRSVRPNTDEGQRKPRGEAGASPKEKTSRGTLDAPILSQTQIGQGADRTSAPARPIVRRKAGRDVSSAPMRMTQMT
jgi:hypothetical protein